MNQVRNIDCMIGMKEYPDQYFDLAIVDPPYGINASNMQMGSSPSRSENNQYPGESTAVKLKKGRLNSGGGHFAGRNLTTMNCDWDSAIPDEAYFTELKRVSKNQIIWGSNYFPLPPTRCMLCWDKKQPWDNFSQFELAWTSFDGPAKLFRQSNRGGANDENKIHPTQKPIKLYSWILHHYATPTDKILDTHLGSGSSRIAAYITNLDFTGFELDKSYFDAQEARFAQHIAQLTLAL